MGDILRRIEKEREDKVLPFQSLGSHEHVGVGRVYVEKSEIHIQPSEGMSSRRQEFG